MSDDDGQNIVAGKIRRQLMVRTPDILRGDLIGDIERERMLNARPEELEGGYCGECGGQLSQSEMADGAHTCGPCLREEHVREEWEASRECEVE